jgi:hypothetical protein
MCGSAPAARRDREIRSDPFRHPPTEESTMTWTAFHKRAEVLRTVVDEADLRRDGSLPTQLAGVTETFHDQTDLVGALQLRWHTRLAGTIDRLLPQEARQGDDLESAVRRAWLTTADQLPGIRAVLDRQLTAPATPEVASALARATDKEGVLLAVSAGRVAVGHRVDPHVVAVGRRIEEAARASYRPAVPMPDRTAAGPTIAIATDQAVTPPEAAPVEVRVPSGSAAFVARLKAALAV